MNEQLIKLIFVVLVTITCIIIVYKAENMMKTKSMKCPNCKAETTDPEKIYKWEEYGRYTCDNCKKTIYQDEI
jgi:transposase-like protein